MDAGNIRFDTVRDELVSERTPLSISEHIHNQISLQHWVHGLLAWLEARCSWGAVQIWHKQAAGYKEGQTPDRLQNSKIPLHQLLRVVQIAYRIRLPPGSCRKQFTIPTMPLLAWEAVSHTRWSEESANIACYTEPQKSSAMVIQLESK